VTADRGVEYILLQIDRLHGVAFGSPVNEQLRNQVFGRSRPVSFGSYRTRRSRWRVPRWLLLLLGGIVIGAAAVVYLQERHLPPRLSAAASAELRNAFERADAEARQRALELRQAQAQLQTLRSDKARLDEEIAASRTAAERLRDDLAAVVAALPPDPRGGSVEVRAGRFSAEGATLDYHVVLLRERSNGKSIPAVLQFVVAGESARGSPTTLALKPITVSIGSHEVLRGSVSMPEGFKPQKATVQVLDRVAGKALGMRVMLVR
jgi:hypothetical protein